MAEDPGPVDQAPAITSFPITRVYQDETYEYPVMAADPEGEAVTYSLARAPAGLSINAGSGLLSGAPGSPGNWQVSILATDPAGNRGTQEYTLEVLARTIPRDPAESAPPLSATSTGFMDDIRFLFDGGNALQTGLEPGALEENRVAVLRGRVYRSGGGALAGVQVEIAGHPELGSTLSRDDGWFDLVANGGGELVLRYTKPGWLPVQRIVAAPKTDYAVAPDIHLTRLDPVATVLKMGSDEPQIAFGSLVEDGDGARRAAVLIPPGTTASYTRADGSTALLEQITLRATEYTVGPDGPKAMPGELPPASGYTYAVEFSVDEVLADGVGSAGKDLVFNQPVSIYVDNFIGFPVGSVVPAGYYDADAARWVASDNGRVIALLGVENGMAQLDLDGSGNPADTAALAAEGVTDAERERLAAAYPPATELWRVRTSHLSPWDLNFLLGPPKGATAPDPMICTRKGDCETAKKGSDILMSAGTLSERIGLAGTGQSLVFNSARRVLAHLEQPLTGADMHPKLKRVEYQISIGGRLFSGSVAPDTPYQSIKFVWDGRDAYGREVPGPVTAYSKATNVYEPVRYSAAIVSQVFATFMNRITDPASRESNGISLASDRANFEYRISTWTQIPIGAAHHLNGSTSLGGVLAFSGLSWLDARRGILTTGSGASIRGAQVLQSLLGSGRVGGQSIAAPVALANDTAGNLLAATGDRIYRIVDGEPEPMPGGDAFRDIRRIRQSRNGQLLVLAAAAGDDLGPRLWSLSANGAVGLVAGDGQSGCGTILDRGNGNEFGLPFWEEDTEVRASRTQLRLTDPSDVAVGDDGDIYLADAGCHVVYLLRPGSGDIYVVAGDGSDRVETGSLPAGGQYRSALGSPTSLALDRQGQLYIGTGHGLIRRLGTDNWIETVAGTGETGYGGDGGPADAARFGPINELLVADADRLYVDDSAANGRLRRIDAQRRVQTLAGDGRTAFTPDGLSASGASIGRLAGLALDSENRLIFGETGTAKAGLRRIASAFAPPPWQSGLRVPVDGGGHLQEFDEQGNPIRTLDAETGTVLASVSYDADNRLLATTDEYGRQTRYERDGEGRIDSVITPTGQRTAIDYDEFDRPTVITQPDGSQWGTQYDARGLLTQYTDPNGNSTRFDYDSLARVVRDTDAAGGGWIIEHDLDPIVHQVRYTTAEGRVNLHTAYTDPDSGIGTQTTRDPNGGETHRIIDPVLRQSDTTTPDGTRTLSEVLPSAVPSGAAPDSRITTTLPSGLSQTTETHSTWTLADADNPESWVQTQRTVQTNGKTTTTIYDPDTRTRTTTSPEGRTRQTTLDNLGRPVQTQTQGLAPVRYTYDGRGLLIETRQGEGTEERLTTYVYDELDHLQSTTDAENRTTTYVTDAMGRVESLTRPDNKTTGFRYDAKGNLVGLTPPGKPEHTLGYSPVDLETGYTPPPIADGTGDIATSYNKDRDMTQRAHALGPVIDYDYDSGGRLKSRTTPEGTQIYGYTGDTDRVAAITTAQGEGLSYQYDGPLNTSVQWTGTVNGTVQSEWNSDFNIAAHVVEGHRIDYGYDLDNLLTRAGDLSLTRHPGHGAVTGTRIGGVTTQKIYNGFGETQSNSAQFQTDHLYQVQYTRDKLGRITQKTETIDGRSQTKTYT